MRSNPSIRSNIIYLAFCILFAILTGCANHITAYEDDDDDFTENIEYKYVASSTHHIQKLFDLEKELVYRLLHGDFAQVMGAEDRTKIDIIVRKETGFTSLKNLESILLTEPSENFVKHPVNAFHTIKRTTQLWPQILLIQGLNEIESETKDNSSRKTITQNEAKILRTLTNFIIRKFPSKDDFFHGTCIGLMIIENTYARKDSVRLDLAKGIVHDTLNGITYKSLHPLSPNDCIFISNVAKKMNRLDRSVEWAKTALELLKMETNPSLAEVKRLERNLDQVKAYHDDTLIAKGLGATVKQHVPDGHPEAPIFTAVKPYDEEMEDIPSYRKSLKHFRKESEIATKLFTDIQPLDSSQDWYLSRSYKRMWYNMAPISRRLCIGDKTLRPPSKDSHLKCVYLHHNRPDLLIGPFKYEPVHDSPHVGMFREFYSNKECNELVDFSSQSQDNLKSPEWNSIDQDGNTITNYYVSHRISKRQNIEEGDHNMTSTSSKRISQSTQWVVNQRPGLSSEQYHLINYGIGGTIDVHVDYWGKKRHPHPGL